MWNAISPGFELVSPCPIPATITITPRTPPKITTIFIAFWSTTLLRLLCWSTMCCIAVIHIQLYTYTCGNKINNNDERTHFFRKIYLSLYSKGSRKGCVRGELETEQTATYWPKVPLSLAALLSYSVRDDERCGRRKEANTPELIAKGLGLWLLCWGFKGVQEEILSEEASTLQIGSVAFPPGQYTSPQLHPCHRLFDQDGHQDSSSASQ